MRKEIKYWEQSIQFITDDYATSVIWLQSKLTNNMKDALNQLCREIHTKAYKAGKENFKKDINNLLRSEQ